MFGKNDYIEKIFLIPNELWYFGIEISITIYYIGWTFIYIFLKNLISEDIINIYSDIFHFFFEIDSWDNEKF